MECSRLRPHADRHPGLGLTHPSPMRHIPTPSISLVLSRIVRYIFRRLSIIFKTRYFNSSTSLVMGDRNASSATATSQPELLTKLFEKAEADFPPRFRDHGWYLTVVTGALIPLHYYSCAEHKLLGTNSMDVYVNERSDHLLAVDSSNLLAGCMSI